MPADVKVEKGERLSYILSDELTDWLELGAVAYDQSTRVRNCPRLRLNHTWLHLLR